jgi:predicted nucleotidyltransferase
LKAARQQPATKLTAATQQEREHLLQRVREAAAAIKTRYGAERVVLFGSLAHAAWFAPNSDVDLAVEGLKNEDYWQAWRLVEEIIGDHAVDLVDLDMASESLKGSIRRYGVEL